MTMRSGLWESQKARQYSSFAVSIPSDLPAYAVTWYFLSVKGKKVLDYGCFQGKSSAHLLQLGAEQVTGVDKVGEHILKARRCYKGESRLTFAHTPKDHPIAVGEDYEAVSMTFVHPTIETKKELSRSFQKIATVTKQGARLVLLGLHRNSFYGSFLFYHHTLEGDYEDGKPFENELELPEGKKLQFTDYCWTEDTLTSLLEENGFSHEQTVNLDTTLFGSAGRVLRKVIAHTEQEHALTWKHEWTSPLYQVIVARKD